MLPLNTTDAWQGAGELNPARLVLETGPHPGGHPMSRQRHSAHRIGLSPEARNRAAFVLLQLGPEIPFWCCLEWIVVDGRRRAP